MVRPEHRIKLEIITFALVGQYQTSDAVTVTANETQSFT